MIFIVVYVICIYISMYMHVQWYIIVMLEKFQFVVESMNL